MNLMDFVKFSTKKKKKKKSSSGVHLENFVIPLEKIRLATQNFSQETRIHDGEYRNVYRGELENRTVAINHQDPYGYDNYDDDDSEDPNSYQAHRQVQFHKELKIISTFHHQNILPFIGYFHEGKQMFTVFEYAVKGSLEQYLEDPDKIGSLTWADRLKICIGAARGLEFLHSGLDNIVIHRDVNSEKILFDDNLEAKLSNFGMAILLDRNQTEAYEPLEDTTSYTDPVYQQSRIANTESDIYSFGVVLFEMLSGMLAYQTRSIDGDEPQRLINLVRRHYKDGLYNLIDHAIRDQMNMRSFKVFKKTAYQCLSWNLKARPTLGMIIKMIDETLDLQNHRASYTVTTESLEYENLERFLIPLKEIQLAISRGKVLGVRESVWVHKGQLSKQWQYRKAVLSCYFNNKEEFVTELKMMTGFNHENIIQFIGFCNEFREWTIVTEFASNGSLTHHLRDPDKSSCLTWAQRMNICVGAARALEYLHSGLPENRTVIHRNLKSTNVLLNDNLDTKICNFRTSLLVNRNEQQVYQAPSGDQYYIDPVYNESGMVSTASDVYSFGVIMFETLCGMLAEDTRSIDDGHPQTLLNLVKRYYDDGFEKIIDPNIKYQINSHSLYTFKKIAYRCISTNLSDCPTMKRILKRFEEALKYQDHGAAYNITTRSLDSYRIPLDEIILATRNFNRETLIGEGGFGVVYKGNLSQSWQNCAVAIKRLDPKGHQGKKEFHAELNLISRFHHPNIIPFVGYCDEQDQMIIVYQYAANKSIDYYLADRTKMCSLSWVQRLNICLGAAKGLEYLHSGLGKHHRVIHRDVKSGNILLDGNLEAKICDFGLSTEVPGDQESSQIFTKAAGTNFYMDPIYYGSGVLRKESDIYSFGVVLFEILSGRPAYFQIKFVDGNSQFLINLVRRYYENAPEKLIDPDIRDQIDSRSFHTFKEIAYQCISFMSAERPTMDTIIDKIEDAIDFQTSSSI